MWSTSSSNRLTHFFLEESHVVAMQLEEQGSKCKVAYYVCYIEEVKY